MTQTPKDISPRDISNDACAARFENAHKDGTINAEGSDNTGQLPPIYTVPDEAEVRNETRYAQAVLNSNF
jgi:hypothetical protein